MSGPRPSIRPLIIPNKRLFLQLTLPIRNKALWSCALHLNPPWRNWKTFYSWTRHFLQKFLSKTTRLNSLNLKRGISDYVLSVTLARHSDWLPGKKGSSCAPTILAMNRWTFPSPNLPVRFEPKLLWSMKSMSSSKVRLVIWIRPLQIPRDNLPLTRAFSSEILLDVTDGIRWNWYKKFWNMFWCWAALH